MNSKYCKNNFKIHTEKNLLYNYLIKLFFILVHIQYSFTDWPKIFFDLQFAAKLIWLILLFHVNFTKSNNFLTVEAA